MNNWETAKLIAADKKYLWHPFTSMHEWCAPDHEPLVLVEGYGAMLRDSRGGEYIDGNSSIWTNIHGITIQRSMPQLNASLIWWRILHSLASRILPRSSLRGRLSQPSLLILAKDLTGSHVPFVITLLTEKIFWPFFNASTDSNTLFYGHSYTGNALACAAAHASLKLFENERVLESLAPKIAQLTSCLGPSRSIKWVNDIRQCGFMAGIEVDDGSNDDRLGAHICIVARKYGLLTRPIRNVIVLFPPFCLTKAQLKQAVDAIGNAIVNVCGGAS